MRPETWTWSKVICQLGKFIKATWLNGHIYWAAWRYERHHVLKQRYYERMKEIMGAADDLRDVDAI